MMELAGRRQKNRTSSAFCLLTYYHHLQDLHKLNLLLAVKSISIGLLVYLCAFIFEPYAED